MGSEINTTALFAEAMRLATLGQLAAAESRLRECLAAVPASTMLLGNLAALLVMQGKYADARSCLEQLLAIDRTIAEAWLNLGIVEEEQHADFETALGRFDEALKLRAAYPEAHYNRANMLAKMNRLDDAIVELPARRFVLRPAIVDALHNLANTLAQQQGNPGWHWKPSTLPSSSTRVPIFMPTVAMPCVTWVSIEAAIKSFDKALQLDACGNASCRGIRLHTKAQICDWSNWQGQIEEMIDSIERKGARLNAAERATPGRFRATATPGR